jgi:hypothetical protein
MVRVSRVTAVKAALCFGLVAASASPAFPGAWTLPQGEGQVLITGSLSAADEAFGGGGSAQSIPRYKKFELQGLIEYGATDRFTLMAIPGLQRVDIDGPAGGQRTGLGYSEFGGRYRFLQNDSWVLSGQTTLRVPGTFEKTNPAAVGYTDPELDARVLIGHSFSAGAWPAFVDLQLAQRFRSGDPPDEFRVDLSFGVNTAPHWLLLAQSFNVFSEGAGAGLDSYRYHKLQLSVVYEITPAWAVQLGGFTTFAGRNALQENGVILGAGYKF